MPKYTTVDEYMAALPPERREVMETLRRAVNEAAPQAAETVAYNMPALRVGGRFLLSYEAYTNHYSVFPRTDRMADQLGSELLPYQHGKGTLRFPAGQPLPLDLIRRIVAIRHDEITASRKE